MTEQERWAPVVGWESLYRVSTAGRVWSVRRKGARGGFIEPAPNHKGYLTVHLRGNGVRLHRSVHRLMAEAFLGEPPSETHQVRHLDGTPANNVIGNLAWGTPAENCQDRLRHGTDQNARKTHCKWGHEFSPSNTRLDPSSGQRVCKACRREETRRRRRKQEEITLAA